MCGAVPEERLMLKLRRVHSVASHASLHLDSVTLPVFKGQWLLCCVVILCVPHQTKKTESLKGKDVEGKGCEVISEQHDVPVTTASLIRRFKLHRTEDITQG